MPPKAMAKPAAVACTAPQVPKAKPVWFGGAACMVAVNVPWPNRPLPKPIKPVPSANKRVDCMEAEAITAKNAGMPTQAPMLAMRNGS